MKRLAHIQRSPVVIALYGVTGVGKSYLAREISKRIPFCHIVATDMLRRVVARYSVNGPATESSYALVHPNAVLPRDRRGLINAFNKQNAALAGAMQGVIEWGRVANRSLVVEGVNAFGLASRRSATVSLHSFLVICTDHEIHMKLLKERHSAHPAPPISMAKYGRYFSNIRFMQEYFVSHAMAKGHESLDPSVLGVASAADRVLRHIGAGGNPR